MNYVFSLDIQKMFKIIFETGYVKYNEINDGFIVTHPKSVHWDKIWPLMS